MNGSSGVRRTDSGAAYRGQRGVVFVGGLYLLHGALKRKGRRAAKPFEYPDIHPPRARPVQEVSERRGNDPQVSFGVERETGDPVEPHLLYVQLLDVEPVAHGVPGDHLPGHAQV